MEKLFTLPHFLGLFFVLMLFSCTQDDLENNTTTSITNQLKNNLKLDQFSNKNISDNLVINWEAFSKIEKEDYEIYEIEANEKKPITIESNLFQSKLKYELIAIKNGTEVNSYLVEAYSNLNHDLYSSSIQNIKNFTGTLNVYELNGNLIGQLLVFNGTAKNTSSKNTIEPLNKVINLFNLKQNKSNKLPACYEAYIVFTVAYAYTDHYSSVTVGNYTRLTFVKTTLETTTTTSNMSSPYPCGTNGDSYHILQRTNTYKNVVDAFKILDELTGEAKCIYEKLRNSSTGFENSIKKFDGDFPVSHLKLTINDNLEPNVYGITLPPVNYITEVQISNNALRSLSDLGKATVFAHEIIHAEIFRKMLSAAQLGNLDPNNMTAQQQTNYVNSLKDNFPGLYDYYLVRYKPTWNHEMMANHYRTTIADIIQKFDNNRLPRSTYEAVSWVGLGVLDSDKGLTTIAWDNLTPAEKTAINNLIKDNFYNGPSNCK